MENLINLNQEFTPSEEVELPNSNLVYDLYEDKNTGNYVGLLSPYNKLNGVNFWEDAPNRLEYKFLKNESDFTDEEKQRILDYRGFNLKDAGFEKVDIFFQGDYIELITKIKN